MSTGPDLSVGESLAEVEYGEEAAEFLEELPYRFPPCCSSGYLTDK